MASLISSTDRESFQNGYLDFFDTFKEDVHVFKAPKKIFSVITSQGVYGYGDQSNSANFTLVPVSGSISAIVTYAEDQDLKNLAEANKLLEIGEVLIDTNEYGKDLLNSGATELVKIKNETFIVIGAERNRDFLGSALFSFKLKRTN